MMRHAGRITAELISDLSRASGGSALRQAVRRGMIDSDQLGEEDAYHFNMWIRGLLLAWENAHYQYRMGMLDSDRWRLHRVGTGTVGRESAAPNQKRCRIAASSGRSTHR